MRLPCSRPFVVFAVKQQTCESLRLQFYMSSQETGKEECPYLHGAVWQKTYLTENTYRQLIALTIINTVSVFPIILINALVIFAVATRRRLQTNSNILLACLASTDLLAGIFVQPLAIAMGLKRLLGVGPFCGTVEKSRAVAFVVVCFSSLNHLVLVTINQYIAIRHSLRYHEIVTKRRLKSSQLLFCSTITLFIAIQDIVLAAIDSKTTIFLVYINVRTIIFYTICSIGIAVIIYTYGYIFLETRRQNKRIHTEQLTHEEAKKMKKDKKTANTLAILLGALSLSYLPIITGFLFIGGTKASVTEPRLLTLVLIWCSTFVMLGSLVNPVIYCWRIKELRRVFLEILHCRQSEKSLETIATERSTAPLP